MQICRKLFIHRYPYRIKNSKIKKISQGIPMKLLFDGRLDKMLQKLHSCRGSCYSDNSR